MVWRGTESFSSITCNFLLLDSGWQARCVPPKSTLRPFRAKQSIIFIPTGTAYSFTSNSLDRSSVTAKAASPEFLFLRFMTSFPPFLSSIRNDQRRFRILSARVGETGLEGSWGAEMHREEKVASCEGSKGNSSVSSRGQNEKRGRERARTYAHLHDVLPPDRIRKRPLPIHSRKLLVKEVEQLEMRPCGRVSGYQSTVKKVRERLRLCVD